MDILAGKHHSKFSKVQKFLAKIHVCSLPFVGKLYANTYKSVILLMNCVGKYSIMGSVYNEYLMRS
jgi:hypothetical protein